MGIVDENDFRINGAEIDCYIWVRPNDLMKDHKLSIRKNNDKFEVYRKFNDQTENIIYKGTLESAVAVSNSQVKVFFTDFDYDKLEYRAVVT